MTKSSKLSPSYESPYVSYTMRTLAWETFVVGGTNRLTDTDIEKAIRRTLKEFGGIEISNPTIYNYTKEIRELLNNNSTKPKGWEGDEWFLLHAPFHRFVRSLSANPIVHGPNRDTFEITFRDPVVPSLRVTIGTGEPDARMFGDNPRVVYLLRHEEENEELLYIGITDNSTTRMEQHFEKKRPHWWFVAQPMEVNDFDSGVQEPAETMLIAFWNEIVNISNDKWGKPTQPSNFLNRQQTTLVTAAVSAAYLHIVRTQEDEAMRKMQIKKAQWQLPFKSWPRTGFSERYINVEEPE